MPHQERIDRRIFDLIRRVREKGIHFCVASGRSYQELLALFGEVKDDIYFMPLDGNLLIYKDKILFGNPLKREHVCRSINMMPDSNVLLYAKDKTYFRWQDDTYQKDLITPHHKNIVPVKKLDDVMEGVYKVTYFKESSVKFQFFKNYVKNNKIFDCLYEDDTWCDFLPKGTSKGITAQFLMKELGISRENAMAFGDNSNDMELLKAVKESYAMENGKLEIKAVARHKCKNVAEEIERMIFNGTVCN